MCTTVCRGTDHVRRRGVCLFHERIRGMICGRLKEVLE